MPAKAKCRRLTLALLLSLAIAARGAQPVDNSGALHLSDTDTPRCGSQADYGAQSAFDQADDICNSYLARIGKELLDPPVQPAERNALPEGAKSLPGVPAAIFMVLTGFLCVSFVNDRRIWLASLSGLLWLGQTGLSAIPQVASRLAGKTNVTQNHRHNFTGAGSYHHRLRSDTEGTQYMGLLRHLAGIPAPASHSIPESLSSLLNGQNSCPGAGRVHCARPEFAITPAASGINNSTVCSACATEHFVLSSPAFAFSNLARGPPRSSWEQ